MKACVVEALKHGLYRIHWKKKYGGGSSVASVGSLYDGVRWYAPANWTHPTARGVTSTDWKKVKRVELITER